MTIFQALILGLTQGLGEFLPISSSAHLILIPWLFNWPDPGLTFDVALHIGTLFAVIAFFWKDWFILIKNGFTTGLKTSEGRMFWYLVVASIPGAIIGMMLEQAAEKSFRNPLIIGVMLLIMGIALYLADRYGTKRQQSGNLSFGQSFLIGLSQALAIIPGVSRSGITIASGLTLGLTREDAARFSFLLSTPIIAGAGLLKLRHLTSAALTTPFMVGVITSAVVGFLVIGILLRWLRQKSFLPFVWYRVFAAAAVFTVYFLRR
jgi:undecaprenyl-diphosphatase